MDIDLTRDERVRMSRALAAAPTGYEADAERAKIAQKSAAINSVSSVLSPWMLAVAAVAGLMFSL